MRSEQAEARGKWGEGTGRSGRVLRGSEGWKRGGVGDAGEEKGFCGYRRSIGCLDSGENISGSFGPNATLEAMKETAPNMTLPGADLIERGIEDLRARRESAEALLVSIGAPRLRSLGVEVSVPIASPEHKLYQLLGRERGDGAHSAYNALIRRLVSFEQAAACAKTRRASSAPAPPH